MINTDERCLRCGGCVGVCPLSALSLGEHGIACSDKCNNCKICLNFCPMGAIKMV